MLSPGLDLRGHFGNLDFMPSKKKPVAASQRDSRVRTRAEHAPVLALFSSDDVGVSPNGKPYEQPGHKNHETAEEREKRLAKREALTLRAFQIAYDNHHPPKSS